MKKEFVVKLLAALCVGSLLAGCGKAENAENTVTESTEQTETVEETVAEQEEESDETDEADAAKAAADEVAALIDAIYVQERNDDTDAACEAAKAAWDNLTDEEKELVEGEFADPDYFGRDTGNAADDDPLNADEIGENEILVVSFGTSFNDSRAKDIGGIEKAIAEAY
ncbi:MAG: cobalt chelatase, partial [Lachnospiraceae bacterium]|nr:cobalt chelatase [Lachnospiraceae bacterium]